jgi:predicted nuclease with TOPRIM domain
MNESAPEAFAMYDHNGPQSVMDAEEVRRYIAQLRGNAEELIKTLIEQHASFATEWAAELQKSRTQLAALRVERDTIARQANRLNDELNAMRVERDQAWNEAIAKAVKHLELTEEFAGEVARGVTVDLSMALRKVTGMVRSLARPIPAETHEIKPPKETQ